MQSVGLVQRAIEAEGIPTISVSLNRSITASVKPPRALLLAFPLGHPMGNPYDKEMQRRILLEGLNYIEEIQQPGEIVDLTSTYKIEAGECAVCKVDLD